MPLSSCTSSSPFFFFFFAPGVSNDTTCTRVHRPSTVTVAAVIHQDATVTTRTWNQRFLELPANEKGNFSNTSPSQMMLGPERIWMTLAGVAGSVMTTSGAVAAVLTASASLNQHTQTKYKDATHREFPLSNKTTTW